MALQRDARQRRAIGIILRRDADHDAGIGVALIAGILAHAVGDDAAFLRGRRHHRAAGAHAETVDAAAIAGMMHQPVFRRAQFLVAGAEAGLVDQALRMLDAKADGKGLGLDRHAAVMQHLEHIAGAVAHRQHDMIGGDLLAAFQLHAAESGHLRSEDR